ncbi:GXGXG motif-containing protein [Chromatiales bacterium (ex Bugula neritina AB1)]|nr:GXGXG motif-containing protein [Chromatiales bacterium (ex Bugula neritina AB1)]
MAELNEEHESHKLGMHTEQLAGRTQQVFFSPSADENFTYPDGIEVDFNKETEFDAGPMEIRDINLKIRDLMKEGYGTITIRNPGAKHSLGVGILNRLNLKFDGSLGYFGCGLADGPNIHISGRVGWSCAENMMAGTIVVEKNAGSTFGAALRGGDLVCKGDVGSRTGIDQKGGTIIIGGRAGAFTGFMMQRGRIVILGDAGKNLGDSMYDGTIFVGGKIEDLGVDAVEGEMTETEEKWLEAKLALYGMKAPNGVKNLTKIVAGKQLWNYDNLEPSEKKLVL